jgi:hypothetical protein
MPYCSKPLLHRCRPLGKRQNCRCNRSRIEKGNKGRRRAFSSIRPLSPAATDPVLEGNAIAFRGVKTTVNHFVDAAMQDKVLGAVHVRLPMPTADEQPACSLRMRTATRNFGVSWANPHGTAEDQRR